MNPKPLDALRNCVRDLECEPFGTHAFALIDRAEAENARLRSALREIVEAVKEARDEEPYIHESPSEPKCPERERLENAIRRAEAALKGEE